MKTRQLFLLNRDLLVEARELILQDEGALVLLLGRAIMLPARLFGERSVYCLAEEVRALGLEGKLSPAVKPLEAPEAVQLLLKHRVVNFG